MTTRQQYAVLAGALAAETVVLVIVSAVAVRLPAAGGVSFLVGAAMVLYYGSQRPLAQGIISGLFNAVALWYFSQSHFLPVGLLFLLVCGVSPHVNKLSAHLSRVVFTALYVTTVVTLVGSSGEGMQIRGTALLVYALATSMVGFAFTKPLARRPSPQQGNG